MSDHGCPEMLADPSGDYPQIRLLAGDIFDGA
jgi:hypothetical protein